MSDALRPKQRDLESVETFQRNRSLYNGSVAYDSGVQPLRQYKTWQQTWSDGTRWPHGQGVRPVGGAFDTISTHVFFNFPRQSEFSIRAGGLWYDGDIIPVYPDIPNAFKQNAKWDDLVLYVPSLGDTVLNARGSQAISACAPTAPTVSGSVALAELYREGLPSLIGAQTLRNRAHLAKSAGSEYLNYEFGWKPLVSDLKAAAKAVMESDAILQQLVRDSGRNVRRRFDFPVEHEVTNVVLSNNAYPLPYLTINHWYNGAPPNHMTVTTRRVWFSGAFTYYLDPRSLEGLSGIVKKARLLYGLQLTPDVVWNLTPWSWLVDWFVNLGLVLTNVGLFANDDLTLRYGYTMENTTVSHIYRWPNLRKVGTTSNVPTPLVGTWQGTRKRRLPQSPFSLGLLEDSLNVRQLAILSALGITRT